MKELREQMRTRRLLTLTGVGGVGKTRLALGVAADLITEFPDGVWLVELAPVGDPAAVPDALAAVLGVTSHPGPSLIDSIAQALTDRRALIVLDNCEHVLDTVAEVVVQPILARTSKVTVMATSREGLRVEGEHLWLVPSLDFDSGERSAAVELFADRARAVVSEFELSDESDIEAVVEICRRLDGIALAIEVAAARTVCR
jgi:predicted ATPase